MNNLKQKIKKITTIFLLVTLLFGNNAGLAFAAPSAPTPPPAPAAPSAPTPPPAPEAPKPPSSDSPEPTPTPSDNQNSPTPSATPQPSSSSEPSSNPSSSPAPSTSPSASPTTSSQPLSQSSPSSAPSGNQTGNQSDVGNTGDTNLETGNATNSSGVVTTANSNLATPPTTSAGQLNSGPSVGIVNSDNGSGSSNSGTASITTNDTTSQQNSAQVSNNVNQTTVTGNNTASDNTGGNTTLKTGDANVTGTIVNSLNTNVDGLSVAEFNVQDDQKGDLILDFASGCISNCGASSANLANTGNGSDSTNNANLTQTTNNSTFQSNDANVGNNMTLSADSGSNNASDNTGGDTQIQTGDANVSANVLTLANNNVAGNVVYTVVNVFGELVGDIVMDQKYLADAGACTTCGGGDLTAVNNGNGSGSDNNVNLDQNSQNTTFQNNDANIENNLVIDANTAGNSTSYNTNGSNNVKTGDANVDANVLNVANSNVAGGVWWLVLVNEAGNWVGKIVGSPDGSNMAGSEGTEFIVNENGEVMAVNSGNGSNSENNINLANNNTDTTTQDNKINLFNNVNLGANTGNNQANDNTGGASKIQTGDANVVANIVNFVNNNITGGGKLFVTVVNVFGSWSGNFVTPDGQKQPHQEQQLAQTQPSHSITPQGEPEEETLVEEEDSQDQSDGATSTTKKTKKAKNASSSPFAAITSGNSGSGGISIGNPLAQVAGVKIGPNNPLPDGAIVGSKKIKINLAWLVLIFPLLGLIALSRIRLAYYTRQIKNKLAAKRVEGVLLGSLVAVCIYLLNRVS